MLRPFVAYLRVYEPLSTFGDARAPALRKAAESTPLPRAEAAEREQLAWLKSHLAQPMRLLPAELANGRGAPSASTDVLTLNPRDVPVDDPDVQLGPGPLVCPLELRARSAAALLNFLGEGQPAVRDAVLSAHEASVETLRARATSALRDAGGSTVHTLSTTWTVPIPWFSLVDPTQRWLVLGAGQHDRERGLSWRAALPEARRRATEARELVENAFGESGPSRILSETSRWLDNFDSGSAVELDYGGLVQLIDDATLREDDSADKVHRILDSLRSGEADQLTELFDSLREYWSELGGFEHMN